MIFETLPTTPTSEELIDTAFSRAARAGRAKSGVEAQQSMLQTASNVLSDNLQNVVTAWPDFHEVDPFYYELADAIVEDPVSDDDPAADDAEAPADAPSGVEAVRQSLSEIQWASRKTKEIGRDYQGRLPNDTEAARKIRKQGFARLADIVEEVGDDLERVGEARNDLRDLPEIDPDDPTVVVAGYPNVGKSSFVNSVTRASNEIAEYPFTTKGIRVGHFDRDHVRYQIVDTPGLLDRPAEERNDIESQAVSALEHLGDCVLVLVDPSGYCGFSLEAQLALRDSIAEQFDDVPVLTVGNKSDLSTDVDADLFMSIENDENVTETLDAAVEAIDYDLELPFDG